MGDKDAATPRVYLIRHGETEWSQTGRFTGITDIPLLPSGEQRVRSTANVVFGQDKLIQPSKIARVYCSPRQRATKTLQILSENIAANESDQSARAAFAKKVNITEDVREWGYGDYEGLLTKEIRNLRKERGHDRERQWDIWRDGAEGAGSESSAEVLGRVDGVIDSIKTLQGDAMKNGDKNADVLVIAHGHILRAFVKRWLEFPLETHVELMLEPGGVCGLSYAHGNVDEPAVLVGMSFPGAA